MSEEPPDTPYVKAKKRFVVMALAFFGMLVAVWVCMNMERHAAHREAHEAARQLRDDIRPKE